MKNRNKIITLVLLFLFGSLLSISIGFSSLSTTLSVNGRAAFIPVDMIRFTKLETIDLSNAYESDKSFLTNDLNFTIELDKINSTATYEATISNLGEVDKVFTEIKNEIYSNELIEYTIDGLDFNTIIKKGESVTFRITFKYKDSNMNDSKLNAKLRFMFEDYVDIQGAYIISFNSNGGEGSMQDMQVAYDEVKTLNANSFYKEGFRFKNWNTKSDGTGISYNNRADVKNINNGEDTVVLYAQWTMELEYIYYPDSCKFSGPDNLLVGECLENGNQGYINTSIKPFSEENYQKSFELSFTIADVDETRFKNGNRDTIFNILYEASDNIKGIYPGTLLRIEGTRWQFQAGDGNSNATKVLFDKDELIGKKFRLIRHNDGNSIKIYYVIGENDVVFVRDMTNLKAYFDTPLTFGANLLIDNETTDRYAYTTLNDIKFEYLDSNLTLDEIVNGQKPDEPDEPDEPEESIIYTLPGPCNFNGKNGFITGDTCNLYSDKKFINTDLYLFNEDNYMKDFEISFELSDFNTSIQDENQVTILNAFLERTGTGYGLLIRRNSNKLDLIIRDGNGISKTVNLVITNPMSFKILKKDNIVCYSINDGGFTNVISMANFTQPFNVPLTFGGSIDKSGKPFRYIKGTLANMNVQIGNITDSCN